MIKNVPAVLFPLHLHYGLPVLNSGVTWEGRFFYKNNFSTFIFIFYLLFYYLFYGNTVFSFSLKSFKNILFNYLNIVSLYKPLFYFFLFFYFLMFAQSILSLIAMIACRQKIQCFVV